MQRRRLHTIRPTRSRRGKSPMSKSPSPKDDEVLIKSPRGKRQSALTPHLMKGGTVRRFAYSSGLGKPKIKRLGG